jgi:hypothetical protein
MRRQALLNSALLLNHELYRPSKIGVIMFEDLQSLLNEHRKQAYLSCDKYCFCWDVENFISCHEQAGGTTTLALDSATALPDENDTRFQMLCAAIFDDDTPSQ